MEMAVQTDAIMVSFADSSLEALVQPAEKKVAFALVSFITDCAKQDVSLDEIRYRHCYT